VSQSRLYVPGVYGQVHVYVAEPANPATRRRTPLVLFHEGPVSGLEFTILMGQLGAHRRVLAPDTPGYGMSDPPPGPLSIEGYSEALMLSLRNAGIRRGTKFDVFGFHTGALIAAEFAARYPKDVRRLVLAGIPYRTGEDQAQHLASLDRNEKPTDLDQWFAVIWKATVLEHPELDPNRTVRRAIETLLPMNHRWYGFDAVYRYDIEGRFREITQPTLVLLMHESLLEPTTRALPLLRHAQAIDMPGANAHAFDTIPEVVAKTMTDFLDR
jgi:pimeloyl-ACP methyl ester carboxylesterase